MGPRELVFWGEWEPPADVRGLGPLSTNVLFSPQYPVFPGRPKSQNTDPFVFDGEFLYCCCKQVRKDGTVTFLRDLDHGDVLIFGSHVGGTFVLDTVFVVGERSTLYALSSGPIQLNKQVPHSFVEATLKPLANPSTGPEGCVMQPAATSDASHADDHAGACGPTGTSEPVEFRLYWGATPENPADGMFSFAPSAIAAQPVPWFDRVDIGIFEFIEKGMTAGFRDCHYPALAGWAQMAKAALGAGLVLGTQFQLRK